MFGVDIGTTCIRVSEYRNNEIVQLPLHLGCERTTDCVTFTGGSINIGTNITHNVFDLNNYTSFGVLRLVGRECDEAIESLSKFWPFSLINDGGRPKIVVKLKDGTETIISPEKVLTLILQQVRMLAVQACKQEHPVFVLAVAGSSTFRQRRAVRLAARDAGMTKVFMVNDTTAIGISKMPTEKVQGGYTRRSILIFDIGGGSVTASIMVVVGYKMQVLTTIGDCHLGGEDFENNIIKFCMDDFRRKTGRKLTPKEIHIVRSNCESAKRSLADGDLNMLINVDKNESCILNQTRIEDLNHEWFNKVFNLLRKCLMDSKLDLTPEEKPKLDKVLFTGCCSQVPFLMHCVRMVFDHSITSVTEDFSRTMVSRGAARLAGFLQPKAKPEHKFFIRDISPQLGVEDHIGEIIPIIPNHTFLPALNTGIFAVKLDSKIWVKVYEKKMPDTNVFLGGVLVTIPDDKDADYGGLDITFAVGEDYAFIITVETRGPDKVRTRLYLHEDEGQADTPTGNLEKLVFQDDKGEYLKITGVWARERQASAQGLKLSPLPGPSIPVTRRPSKTKTEEADEFETELASYFRIHNQNVNTIKRKYVSMKKPQLHTRLIDSSHKKLLQEMTKYSDKCEDPVVIIPQVQGAVGVEGQLVGLAITPDSVPGPSFQTDSTQKNKPGTFTRKEFDSNESDEDNSTKLKVRSIPQASPSKKGLKFKKGGK